MSRPAAQKKWKPYPRYKPSGVEWLGEVPEHWEMSRLKHIARFTTGWTPPTSKDEYYFGANPWATIADLGQRFLGDPKGRISDDAIASSRMRISPKGSLLFSFKLSIGQVSIANRDLYTNEAIATFPPDNGTNVGYLYWAAPFFIPMNSDENIYGAKLLGQETIKNATFVVPPLAEQRAIAAFLDRETARIDALIEKKRRQIELLREKRSTLISHAVTKGLDPNVKMKDSGIEWLGEIPAHWDVRRLKTVARFGYGDSLAADDRLPGICPVYGSNGVVGEHDRANTKAPCLIIGRKGSFGKVAYSDIPCFAIDTTYFIDNRFTSNDLRWLYYCLQWLRLDSFSKDSAVPGLSREDAYNNIFPFCPLDEQHAIAAFLDHETALIDAIIGRVEKSIELLQEYRTALISAAVTGMIDVRGKRYE